ncbi:unnamed protein product [Sympodiomycopsis kandeliae]
MLPRPSIGFAERSPSAVHLRRRSGHRLPPLERSVLLLTDKRNIKFPDVIEGLTMVQGVIWASRMVYSPAMPVHCVYHSERRQYRSALGPRAPRRAFGGLLATVRSLAQIRSERYVEGGAYCASPDSLGPLSLLERGGRISEDFSIFVAGKHPQIRAKSERFCHQRPLHRTTSPRPPLPQHALLKETMSRSLTK